MNLTLWIFALAAVGAIFFFGRRKWRKKVETAQVDRVKRKQAAEDAELDRRACLDLGKSLMANVPSSRSEAGTGANAGAVKTES